MMKTISRWSTSSIECGMVYTDSSGSGANF
jgi:hypothetical protein